MKYIAKEDREVDAVTYDEAERLLNGGVYNFYEEFRQAAQKDLHLNINPSDEYQTFLRRKGKS